MPINYILQYHMQNRLNKQYIITMMVSLLLIIPVNAYAEHIFENSGAFAQQPDIVQLSSEKFIITVDDISYDMYYGYHGSFDSMASDDPQPVLESMLLNQERKSLEITFESVPENSIFWVRMPDKVISAEKGQFQVYVDDKKTKYELIQYPNDMSLGIIMPKDGEHVEIIGTKVIPEFGSLVLIMLGISTLGMMFALRKSNAITMFQK